MSHDHPCAVCPEIVGRMWEPGSESVILTKRCPRCIDRLISIGCEISREFSFIDAVALEVPRILLPLLAQGKCSVSIEQNVRVHTTMDTASSTIGARICNRSGYTGRGVTIAVADTGIYPHPDFMLPRSRIKHFVDLVGGLRSPYDDNGHGTFCAGCAAGNGNASQGKYAGIAPDADLVVIKAMDAAGGGTASDVLTAMQWVIDHHREFDIKVFSLSLGAVVSGFMIDAMTKGAQKLWNDGVVVVAAAGNNGPKAGSITSPGTSGSVITVGAVDDRAQDGAGYRVPDFSSRGPVLGVKKPDLIAPGVSLTAPKADPAYLKGVARGSGYTTMSGTSVACPIVAGCCALMIQAYPSWSPDQIRAALLRTAIKVTEDENSGGAGLIDVAAALRLQRATA